MPTKRTVAQLKTLTDQTIKTNGNEEITAAKDNALRQDEYVSFLNLKDGGLVIEAESGYSTPITPSTDYSFATKKYVDDNAGGSYTASNGVILTGSDFSFDFTVLSASSPLAYNSGTGVFSIQVANGSQNGYLSSSDWNTFNSKLTSTLANEKIWVGNGSNVATAVTPSGDWSIDSAGNTVNNGLLTKALPALATGNLRYNGSAWIFDSTSYLPSFTSQSANLVYRSGDSGGVPAFGSLSLGDMPVFAGYVASPGTITSSDKAFTAIQKLDGNFNAKFNNTNFSDNEILIGDMYGKILSSGYRFKNIFDSINSKSTIGGADLSTVAYKIGTASNQNVVLVSNGASVFTVTPSGDASTSGGFSTANTSDISTRKYYVYDSVSTTYKIALESVASNVLKLGTGFGSVNTFGVVTSTNQIQCSSPFTLNLSSSGTINSVLALTISTTFLNSNSFPINVKTGDTNLSTGNTGDVTLYTGNQVVTPATGRTGSIFLDVGTNVGTGSRGIIGMFTRVIPNINNGEGILFLGKATTAPTGNPTNGFIIWTDPTTGNLMARGSAGTVTTLATA